jgi:hypothetical protein
MSPPHSGHLGSGPPPVLGGVGGQSGTTLAPLGGPPSRTFGSGKVMTLLRPDGRVFNRSGPDEAARPLNPQPPLRWVDGL